MTRTAPHDLAMSRAVRLRWPGVRPIELWDALIDGHALSDARDDRELAAMLTVLLADIGRKPFARRGPADGSRHSAAALTVEAIAFDSVVLCGGRATAVFPVLAERVPRCRLVPDPIASGVRGGLAALREQSIAGPHVAIDVGQTFIKISDGEGLYLGERKAILGTAHGRGTMAQFITHALSDWRPAGARARASFALALCCEIRDDLTLDRNTYGDPPATMEEIAAALDRAGYRGARFHVANDAEMAARDPLMPRATAPNQAPTLLLTLGSGVGAALLLPEGRS